MIMKTPTLGLFRLACLCGGLLAAALPAGRAADLNWFRTARVFLIDAYRAALCADARIRRRGVGPDDVEMHVNTVRIATMGKERSIQGVRFSHHPALGAARRAGRDHRRLQTARHPRGGPTFRPDINSPGHGHQGLPGIRATDPAGRGSGPPPHLLGEDHGTVCWNRPYRQAFMDLVEHVTRDYDVDGLYFDTWRAFYFWPESGLLLRRVPGRFSPGLGGQDIPWHEQEGDYTRRTTRSSPSITSGTRNNSWALFRKCGEWSNRTRTSR